VARTDYLDDPDAPRPTSIVITASAFVLDDAGRLLMIRRTDSGLHALSGGRHELGETMTATAIRETTEETGILIEITGRGQIMDGWVPRLVAATRFSAMVRSVMLRR
jgi:8-oxo-dGTP pyrophosphatase MutT (NUDIX family)